MFKAQEIIEATGARCLGPWPKRPFRRICQDSRAIRKGDVFIAIFGKRFDGHRFLKDVFGDGINAAIIQDNKLTERDFPGKTLFIVPDTLKALGDLAAYWRRKFSLPIIGITGSNGKTTTKDLIAHLLKADRKVLKTEGNQNNLIGLPFTLFRLNRGHDIAVVELGISFPFEGARLAQILSPTAALITNIGDTHLETMRSRSDIARAKTALYRALPGDGAAFVNADDPYLSPFQKKLHCRVVTFGLNAKNADVRGEVIQDLGLRGLRMRCLFRTAKPLTFHLPLPGRHNAANAVAAVAMAAHFGVSHRKITARMQRFQAVGGRSRILFLKRGITVIDDSYSANPTSMARGIEMLKQGKVARYAVLGDMLELGKEEKLYHQQVGKLLSKAGIENILTLGPLSQYINSAVRRANKNLKVFGTLDQKALIRQLKRSLVSESGALVLVKGSHGMKMDRVVDALVKSFGKEI